MKLLIVALLVPLLASCVVRNHPEYGYLGALGGKGKETHPNGYALEWDNEKSFSDGTALGGRIAGVIGTYKTASIFGKTQRVDSNNSVLKNASNNDVTKVLDGNATNAAINANNNATAIELEKLKEVIPEIPTP